MYPLKNSKKSFLEKTNPPSPPSSLHMSNAGEKKNLNLRPLLFNSKKKSK
jgi:hypothetical protein